MTKGLNPFYLDQPRDLLFNRIPPIPERVYNAICDSIDIICDNSGSARAKYKRSYGRNKDNSTWVIRVLLNKNDDYYDWYIAWVLSSDKENQVDILYIGEIFF